MVEYNPLGILALIYHKKAGVAPSPLKREHVEPEFLFIDQQIMANKEDCSLETIVRVFIYNFIGQKGSCIIWRSL